MATTLDDVIKSLPPERRAKIEHLTEELVEEVATLRELRKKQKLTQTDMAQLLVDSGVNKTTIMQLKLYPCKST